MTVAFAALTVSFIAVGIAFGSFVFARRADARARRTERRQQIDHEYEGVHRVGRIMRGELFRAALGLSETDAEASRRVAAAQARLTAAIEASGRDLPACLEYAKTADPGLMRAAEQELGRASGEVWRALGEEYGSRRR